MTKLSTVKVELHPVSLKSVTPVMPRKDEEKLELADDLTKMGCEGLLLEPWALKNEAMVQEFQKEHSNQWEGTIRRDPDRWTADQWSEVYRFCEWNPEGVTGRPKLLRGTV